MTTNYTEATIAKYWAKVVVSEDPDACWGWQGATASAGYGRLREGNSFVYAHRLSLEIHGGLLPDGYYACHHCDNPPCSNPRHLFAGTATDNARDRDAKGRATQSHLRGSDLPQARLTEVQVIEIRQLNRSGISQRALARRFSVDPSTISKAVTGANWHAVTEVQS